MIRYYPYLLFSLFLCAGCGGGSMERTATIDLYLTAPLTATEDGYLPLDFARLLEPRVCEGSGRQLTVRLLMTRLDVAAGQAIEIEVPVTLFNSLRQSADTYTHENQVDNFADEGQSIPLPKSLLEPGDQAADLTRLDADQVYYCCGGELSWAGVDTQPTTLNDFAEVLQGMTCDEELPEDYQLAFLHQGGKSGSGREAPSTFTAPAAAPQPIAGSGSGTLLEQAVRSALNAAADQDVFRSRRYELIPQFTSLFSDDAHVKVRGDNGTVVETLPVADYLERVAGFISVDSLYVDEVLVENDKCFEVRLREIHNK